MACAVYSFDLAAGIGTIVGSAIFNVLVPSSVQLPKLFCDLQLSKVITGCCPMVAPKHFLKVNWAFFLRDAGFSAISILLLRSMEIQWKQGMVSHVKTST